MQYLVRGFSNNLTELRWVLLFATSESEFRIQQAIWLALKIGRQTKEKCLKCFISFGSQFFIFIFILKFVI